MIKSPQVKGLQVAPAELEGHLLMHPNVADAAVIGTPDEYAGELPKAFVVLQPAAASLARHDPKYATEFRSSIYKVGEKKNHISIVPMRYFAHSCVNETLTARRRRKVQAQMALRRCCLY